MIAPRSAIPTDEPKSVGLVAVRTPDQVTAARESERQAAIAAANPPEALPVGVVANLRKKWEAAKLAKNEVEQDMLRDLRQVNSEYDPDQKAALEEQGQPLIYMRLTAVKKKAALAWINEIVFQGGDKPWGLDASPIPDLNPDLVEQIKMQAVADTIRLIVESGQPVPPQAIQMHAARLRAMTEAELDRRAEQTAIRMEEKIADQFLEVDFEDVLKTFFDHLCTFPTAFIKGPLVRWKRSNEWRQTPTGWRPVRGQKVVTAYEAPHPLDIYVTDDTADCQSGTIFHRMQLSRAYLIECRELMGAQTEAINSVIFDHYDKGVRTWIATDSERARLEDKDTTQLAGSDRIEVLDCYTTVSGRELMEEGLYETDEGPVEIDKEYAINAWMFRDLVLYIAINDHPTGTRPISSASYEVKTGSLWGTSLPRAMRDKQALCNAAARSIARNMEIASGPQAAVDDITRLPADEDIEDMYPWKIWQFNNDRQSTNPPIYFFQPSDNTEKLMRIYEKFASEADNDTGIPAYSYGSDQVAGAGKTLGGLSILSNNAARGIRLVLSNIDRAIRQCVERQYTHNMLYDDDESIKGDLVVSAKGAMSMVIKETLQQRRLAYLQATNNPVDNAIIGLAGRAAIHREVVKSLDMDIDEVVPPDEAIRQKELAMSQQAMLQGRREQRPTPQKPKKEPRQ